MNYLIVAVLALAIYLLFLHRHPATRPDNSAVLPSQPGTPDKTKQQPKQVPWRGGPIG